MSNYRRSEPKLMFFSYDSPLTKKLNPKYQISAKQKEKMPGCPRLYQNCNDNNELWLTFGV